MKKLFILILMLSIFSNVMTAQELTERLDKSLRFGLSVGIERKNDKPNDAYLDPSTYELKVDNLSRESFVISTTLIYMPQNYYRTVNTAKDKNGNDIKLYGEWEYMSSRLGIAASLNIADYAPNGGFNKRIDGGIGLAFALGVNEEGEEAKKFLPPSSYITLTADFSSQRQIRESVKNTYINKQVIRNGQPLNALDQTDNSLFTNRTFGGISIKYVFIFN